MGSGCSCGRRVRTVPDTPAPTELSVARIEQYGKLKGFNSHGELCVEPSVVKRALREKKQALLAGAKLAIVTDLYDEDMSEESLSPKNRDRCAAWAQDVVPPSPSDPLVNPRAFLMHAESVHTDLGVEGASFDELPSMQVMPAELMSLPIKPQPCRLNDKDQLHRLQRAYQSRDRYFESEVMSPATNPRSPVVSPCSMYRLDPG
eukprot:TRINITY_DN1525_c0_g1_i3.p2 TRINITY_DN1525_c0_g1~~TRINITY_DN1525_c0_g1_i3.p2  ORF type:complete len:204 (+),score=30.01 TRINITY_DN1525_c0_g1_i3:87-698(+)